LSILAGFGLLVVLAYLVTPTSFAVAGFFFDPLADMIERETQPPEPIGRALPIMDAVWLTAKFAVVALIVNVFALLLLLVPGINAVAFFGANAYLFGRGYFELSALRYLPMDSVDRLRRRHMPRLFIAGMVVAAFLLVPILNLLTPLFATAFMVRVSRPLLKPELLKLQG
jgi:CysZ protein